MTNTSPTFVEQVSLNDFDTTLRMLVEAIESAGLTVFARIDHAAAARSVGLTMPPTVLLLYGNPRGGTPIMVAAPRSALELPLKVLLREGADGKAILSFHRVGPAMRDAGVGDDMAMRLGPSQELLLRALRP